MTAKWCPGCRREIPEPPLNPTTTYAKFWRDNLCYICDSRLRRLEESPRSANPACTATSASLPPDPQSAPTPAQDVRHSDDDADVATDVAFGSRRQERGLRGDVATRSDQIEAERPLDNGAQAVMATPESIHQEYLELLHREAPVESALGRTDHSAARVFLWGKFISLSLGRRYEDLLKLLRMGHDHYLLSGEKPEGDPFVDAGISFRVYCPHCCEFKLGPTGVVLIAQCPRCKKSFCPEHALPSAFRGALCPYCGRSLIQSKASLAKFLWNRYFITLFVLILGVMFSYASGFGVTSPERVLSAPESFVSTPFEFRYVGLVNTQVLTDDREKTVVMLDLSVQDRPFKVYGAISRTLFQELNQTQRLLIVKGNYDKKSDRYVLSDLTIPYGWWGSLCAVFYQATRLIFNHRFAVMTASFGIWFILSAIWTLFKMAVSEEIGELADIGKETLGEL
jgi:hypothetical protein